jgi:two-component system, LytTR family, sensor kinase
MPSYLKSAGKIFIRFRILHIVYWAFIFLSLIHEREERFNEPFNKHLPDAIISTGTIIVCVYTIIYLLVPRLLRKNRVALFILASISAIALTAVVYALLLNFYNIYEEGKPLRNMPILAISHLIETFVNSSIFLAATLTFYWFQNDRKAQRTEKEKLEAELNYLKAQFNPHFLFNALNSIYILIDMDKKAAADTLLKFSDLLRYQLYDCAGKNISAASELSFLKDYVELETLRHGEFVEVNYDLPENIPYFSIEPYLLIPFVENAFKHVSKSPGRNNRIIIKAEVEKKSFHFNVINTYEQNCNEQIPKIGGIGLQNVRRRLELLYPGNHSLEIDESDGVYSINLMIYAKENEMSYH